MSSPNAPAEPADMNVDARRAHCSSIATNAKGVIQIFNVGA